MFVFYAFVFFICFIIVSSVTSRVSRSKPLQIRRPPSPPALPIIGHLHLLSPSIAKSFQALATRYGPLMLLNIVSRSSIVVSNAAIAREILKENEINFLARPVIGSSDYNIYHEYTFIFAEYGKYWRFMRKLCMAQIFSPVRMKGFGDTRREEMLILMERLSKCSEEGRACDLKLELLRMTNNITCRVLMSTNEDESMMISKLVKDVMEHVTKYSLGESFGPLGKLGFSHYGRKMKTLMLQFDVLLEKKMVEREKMKRERKDIMDFLLQVYRNEDAEMKLRRNHIKSFLMEMLTAGSETTSDSALWTLGELINHPRVFTKLREEINMVVGSERLVEDSDIPDLPYLQAIVKESLRLHPPASLMLRRSVKDCKISGYDILANENVFLNLIPILTDPSVWENPLDFVPERFTERSQPEEQIEQMDVITGQSFKLIPFGAGRRGCPGATLALAISHGVIAKLVQCFDFVMEEGKVLNMEETGGMSNGMLHPLMCYPKKRLSPFVM